jgi:hypothetical protein
VTADTSRSAGHSEPASSRSQGRRTAASRLADVVRHSAGASALAWFERALEKVGGPAAERELFVVHAGAGRRMRRFAAVVAAEEASDLEAAGLVAPGAWPLERIARAALLATALEHRDVATSVTLVRALFRGGDNDEREAVLRSLVLLPSPERHLQTALEACRVNVQSVFEAIACDNRYPERHLPEAGFNQMILKALFLGVALARVEGLDRRRNAELARMAAAYASERRAAGRSVPADIALLGVEAGNA